MKRNQSLYRVIRSLAVIVGLGAAVMTAACGSSGGGSAAVTGGIVDENGQALTTVSTTDPVNLSLTNLSANSRYSITVTSPAGTAMSPDGGFIATTDEDGALPTSTIVQDLSTTENGFNSLVLYSSGLVPRRYVETGEYTVVVTDEDGTEVFTDTFSAVDGSKAYCEDSTGVARASFTSAESVFVKLEKGEGDLADGTYTCYVVSDLNTTIADQDILAGSTVSVTVASGEGSVTMGTFGSGQYDVVCDIDADGRFDAIGDIISRPGRFNPCFTIQEVNSGNDIIGQICADRRGNYRDIFDPNATDTDIRDVFAWISPPEQSLVEHAVGVRKYVVSHQDNWTDGDVLTDVDEGFELDPVQGFCTNESPWLVWPRQNLREGCYDCVIDVDADGIYDKGTDFVDNIDNTSDNTIGGMCVSDSACTSVTITSHSDGDSVDTTAITLAGAFTEAPSSAKVIVSAGSSSNTINLDVSALTTYSAAIPLFSGENQVTVAATQSDGTICSKTISITSTSTSSEDELFRVQMTWDGSTDMDLHLVRPAGAYANGGYGVGGDCNYGNCKVGLDGSLTNSIDWGTASDEADDPSLDVDCVSCGNGIENIWMNEINEDGVYEVYVDAFSGTETAVQVTVFIRGSTVGTVNCGAMASGTATDSCYVGDIDWDGGSTGSGTFTAVGTTATTF